MGGLCESSYLGHRVLLTPPLQAVPHGPHQPNYRQGTELRQSLKQDSAPGGASGRTRAPQRPQTQEPASPNWPGSKATALRRRQEDKTHFARGHCPTTCASSLRPSQRGLLSPTPTPSAAPDRGTCMQIPRGHKGREGWADETGAGCWREGQGRRAASGEPGDLVVMSVCLELALGPLVPGRDAGSWEEGL